MVAGGVPKKRVVTKGMGCGRERDAKGNIPRSQVFVNDPSSSA
jgi:hypothetical protein